MRKREEDALRVDFTLKDESASTSVETPVVVDSRLENGDHDFPIDLDYLAPFISPGMNSLMMTDTEAEQVYDECLSTCRDRLVQRATIIQNRLLEETKKLEDIQSKYEEDTKKTGASKETFERATKDLMFRIQVLQKRLKDHEESSVQKYKVRIFFIESFLSYQGLD